MEAVRNNRLEAYAVSLIREQQEHGLPPFGQRIVLAIPDKSGGKEAANTVHAQLAALVQDPWQLSHPLQAFWHKKGFWNIFLENEQPGARLPAELRKTIVSLPSPWRALENPLYLM